MIDFIHIWSIEIKSLEHLYLQNCNGFYITKIVLDGFQHLRSIIIGNACYTQCEEFIIKNCPSLYEISIGKNCFNKGRNDKQIKQSGIFCVKQCKTLITLKIGQFSFGDFSTVCEIAGILKIVVFKPIDNECLEEVDIGDLSKNAQLDLGCFARVNALILSSIYHSLIHSII